ncbi:hypothetical protein [Robertmurraya sp. Marseille-Q9965]
MIFGLFAASVVLLFGAIYNFLSLKKPGFYPPKRVLKRRATLLACIAVVCILLGMTVVIFK